MGRTTVVLVLMMAMGSLLRAADPQRPLFGFTTSGAAAEWLAVNDGVMGGVSDGRFRITSSQTLEFFGTLSLENNGGFASVRSVPRELGLRTGDTLVIRMRGDGREYQVNLYSAGGMRAFSYRAAVPTPKGEWIEVRLPLDQFEATSFGRTIRGADPVNPPSVTSVGFLLAEKAPGPFILEVAWINVLAADREEGPPEGLGTDAPFCFEQSESGLTLALPPGASDEPDRVVVLDLRTGDRVVDVWQSLPPEGRTPSSRRVTTEIPKGGLL